jgi:hypothetical protein
VRYILVLKWSGSSASDYEGLVDMETLLETELGDSASVDGHDFGSGEMNIFLETDEPVAAFSEVVAALGNTPRWSEVRAAYRESMGERYEILWPPTLQQFAVN